MKKIAVLSVVIVSALTMSSFTMKSEKKESSAPVKIQMWKSLCADGSVGGYFECDCTQSQANAIAYVMCH
jgi:hypothetical protein